MRDNPKYRDKINGCCFGMKMGEAGSKLLIKQGYWWLINAINPV